MRVIAKKVCDVVEDVRCDVCGASTSNNSAHEPEFGVLQADWGYGSQHDGEQYELHLCETCFFSALATLKAERSACHMLDDDSEKDGVDDFGRV
ncbi:hypothetical protein [Nitrincola sp.]|uniref:hypothetical protein n=1 Tax=Nitrincola sp. TaxID=1926584 RepID=UPI003A8CFB99